MKTSGEGSTEAAGTPGTPVKAVPVGAPLFKLKRPITREDVPQLQSAANLLKGTLNGELSERQRECLAKDPSVGSLYKKAMVRDETTTYDLLLLGLPEWSVCATIGRSVFLSQGVLTP